MAKTKSRVPPSLPPLTDADDRLLATALDELIAQQNEDDLLELLLRPQTALALATLVQIGLKHPPFGVEPYGTAFLHAVRVFFKDAPAVLEVLDRS